MTAPLTLTAALSYTKDWKRKPTMYFREFGHGYTKSKFRGYCKLTGLVIWTGQSIRHVEIIFADGRTWTGWTSNDILGQLRVTGIEILEAYDPEHGAFSITYSFADDSQLTKPKYQTPQRGWQHPEQA